MTIYYVRKSGNDGNAGTGTSVAWLTINRALSASGTASGDTVYIGSGVYREEVTVNMVSAVAETIVYGDIHGQYTGDLPGEVRITNFLIDDTTAPSEAESIFNLNGRDYLTFENLTIQAVRNSSNESIFDAALPTSKNITLRNCTLINIVNTASAVASIIDIVNDATDEVVNWLIDRCIFFMPAGDAIIRIVGIPGAISDYNINVVVQNSVFLGLMYSGCITLTCTPGQSFQPGGVVMRNCSVVGGTAFATMLETSTSIPCQVYNNLIIAFDYYALDSANMGEITEDYNMIFAALARDNVSTGTHSIADGSYAPLFHIGQEFQNAQHLRPFLMPTDGSPLLGFGGHASVPAYDIMNRPRPAGGLSTGTAVGAYERHDTGTEDTSVFDSAPASMKIRGPGDHDFEIPVNPISTNITVMVRYDANHGETNKPQVQILANPSIGVSAETLTMTDGIDTWEMLSFSNFTPTDYGIIILRCISRSATGNGIAYFDSITV